MGASQRFDAIVIGSGIGGLAAASLLARVAGRRVLVLERHFKPGGFTHTFQRGHWHWDVGVHYVGGMGEGQAERRLFDLASGGALRWARLPHLFERFVYPGLTLEVPADAAAYRTALKEAFPRERAGVDRWFRVLAATARWAQRHFLGLAMPRPVGALLGLPGRSAALRTTGEALGAAFRDPLLRAVAASQWGDYGLPPAQSALVVHALIATHYLRGAWYPEGGAGEIARTFLAGVEAAGGECRINHEVTEILVDGGRATGVRALARAVIQHVGDGLALVGEAKRITRPGGRIVIADIDWGSSMIHPGDPRLDPTIQGRSRSRSNDRTVGGARPPRRDARQ
jgi:phytoene dehydrogenase-like protein